MDELLGLVVHADPGQFRRYGWLDAAAAVADTGGCAELRNAAAAERVSWPAVAHALRRLWDEGIVQAGRWSGFIKRELAALWGVSERTARRLVKVLRAAGFLEGWPPDPYHEDEGGYFARNASTFRIGLPLWCRSAHWKRRETPAPPSGQRWPQKSGPVTPGLPDPSTVARKTHAHDTPQPGDTPAIALQLPADYLQAAERARAGRPRC